MDLTKRGRDKLLPNYADHIIELSNGTIMRVGVCSDCKLLLVSGDQVQVTADNILQNHIEYWDSLNEDDSEVAVLQSDKTPVKMGVSEDLGQKTIPNDYQDFTVVDPNTDEISFLNKKNNNLIDTNL